MAAMMTTFSCLCIYPETVQSIYFASMIIGKFYISDASCLLYLWGDV